MPTVRFGQYVLHCEAGENLRRVLMREKLPLYHAFSRIFHCRGLGTCGTCAVKLRGTVSWQNRVEDIRLSVPPHQASNGLRLACQCQVEGDIVVEKFGGVWGQKLDCSIQVDRINEQAAELPRRMKRRRRRKRDAFVSEGSRLGKPVENLSATRRQTARRPSRFLNARLSPWKRSQIATASKCIASTNAIASRGKSLRYRKPAKTQSYHLRKVRVVRGAPGAEDLRNSGPSINTIPRFTDVAGRVRYDVHRRHSSAMQYKPLRLRINN